MLTRSPDYFGRPNCAISDMCESTYFFHKLGINYGMETITKRRQNPFI